MATDTFFVEHFKKLIDYFTYTTPGRITRDESKENIEVLYNMYYKMTIDENKHKFDDIIKYEELQKLKKDGVKDPCKYVNELDGLSIHDDSLKETACKKIIAHSKWTIYQLYYNEKVLNKYGKEWIIALEKDIEKAESIMKN